MSQQTREALFISHAKPEDNAFARWLGAKLAAMGYEVWADVMRLHGGADWSRELEVALRLRAAKVLLVCTPSAMTKQGVRNEIEIAAQLSQQLRDPEFIIPLRLKDFEAHFQIAQLQYVDFANGWGVGLMELVELLSTLNRIGRRGGRPMQDWLSAQTLGATSLIPRKEWLMSNWLSVKTLPSLVQYCERLGAFPIKRFQDRTQHQWPIVPFGTGILTFATPDSEGLPPSVPARKVRQLRTLKFLEEGWHALDISPYDARNLFANLANQAFENFLRKRGLKSYEGANGRFAWWGDIRTVPLTQIPYKWRHWKGRRQIIGVSGKRGVHWHYAVAGHFRTAPMRHVRLSARLIFSENGMDALTDVKRMHRLRRSFAKSWRNARWRDMMLAFLWWLSGGVSEIELLVSHQEQIKLRLPGVSFSSTMSAIHAGHEPPDEDDPDFELDEWDELTDESQETEDEE
jgi:hypothetical protein